MTEPHSDTDFALSPSQILRKTLRKSSASLRESATFVAETFTHGVQVERKSLIWNDDEGDIIPNLPVFSNTGQLDTGNTMVNLTEETPLLNADKPLKIPTGRSTFTQSMLNTVNLMIGMTLLSLPYTLKLGGWFGGLGVIVFGAITTLYTAMLLGKCMEKAPHAVNLGDLGYEVFGTKGRYLISLLYIFELVSCGVSYVLIVGDSMFAMMNGSTGYFGVWTLTQWKIAASSIMVATSWVNSAAILALSSAMGILASLGILLITVYDGVTTTGPGSIWNPADTRMLPAKFSDIYINFGLVIFAYSGHSVIPTIYKDMKKPGEFKTMLTGSYSIFMIWFIGIPVICYLMFGDSLMEEFTLNLWNFAGYNKSLNGMLMWVIVIVCLSKYALVLSPVIQLFLPNKGLQTHAVENRKGNCLTSGTPRRIFVTSIFGFLIWNVANYWPNFIQVVSFVGALFSFCITLVFPSICHYIMFKEENGWFVGLLDILLAICGILGSIFGTYGCFLNSKKSA